MQAICRMMMVLWGLLAAQVAAAELPHTIHICDDVNEWPPFTYLKRENGVVTKQVVGYSVDFVRRVLASHGVEVSLELVPWKRCQVEVEAGRYDMLLNATSNPERERLYLLTKPYYQLTPIAIYLTRNAPPHLAAKDDLDRYQYCGEHGYSYERWGIASEKIDMEALNVSIAMKKLEAERCQLFLSTLEIMTGEHAVGGPDYLRDPRFAYVRIPDLRGEAYHMMISRSVPYASSLKAVLDKAIDDMGSGGLMSMPPIP